MSDLEKIKQLRQSTGAGFKDCNAAIKEAKGDLDKASEILRIKVIIFTTNSVCSEMKGLIQGLEKLVEIRTLEGVNETKLNRDEYNNVLKSKRFWEGFNDSVHQLAEKNRQLIKMREQNLF